MRAHDGICTHMSGLQVFVLSLPVAIEIQCATVPTSFGCFSTSGPIGMACCISGRDSYHSAFPVYLADEGLESFLGQARHSYVVAGLAGKCSGSF